MECGRLEKRQEHQSATVSKQELSVIILSGSSSKLERLDELTFYLRLGLYVSTSVLHRLFKSTSEQECTVLYRTREQHLSSIEIRVFRQPMYRWPDKHNFARIHAGDPHSAPLFRAPITLWYLTRIIFVSMGHFRLDHLFIRLYLSGLGFPVFLYALLVENSGDRLLPWSSAVFFSASGTNGLLSGMAPQSIHHAPGTFF